jgi:plastocyanin
VKRRAAVVAALLVASACGGDGGSDAAAGPYVVTAIDYHFHDAHPSLPIALDRAVEFSNQARNPHNVTIEGTEYSETMRPGERIQIDPISSVLPAPGRYAFYCKFHVDRGMSGVLVVTSG